jgi:cobalt-zinc-cadmium efflux system outer membrane protein
MPLRLSALLVLLLPSLLHSDSNQEPAASSRSVSVGELLRDTPRLLDWLADHHQEIAAAAARIAQARADLGQSRLHPNPSLSASLSDLPLGTTNPPGLGFAQTAIYGVSLAQTVELGKRGPRIAAAELRLDAQHELYLDTLGDRAREARAALARVAYLSKRQQALEESLGAARQIEDLQRARFEHGDLSGNDYDRLSLDTLVLASDTSQNRSAYAAALSDCRAALAADCDASQVGGQELDAAAALPEDAGGAADLDARPDLHALALAEQASQQEATLARRQRIPDPSLSLGYTRDTLTISGDQPRTWLAGITLPVPLFDHGQHAAARAAAHAEELQRSLQAARLRARAEIEALLEQRDNLQRTLGTLRGEALPRSKRVLDSTVAAVNQGELGMTDLLLARRTHNELVLKVMELEFGAFSVRNDLRQALGLDAAEVRQKEGESWRQP